MRLRTVIALFISAVFGAGLAACGGGSVSTGGGSGGAGGTGVNSSLVLRAPQTASADEYQGGAQQGTSLASTISEFLISNALAQDGVTVYLFDATDNSFVTSGVTDGSGEVVFAVSSGEYIVCLNEGGPDATDAVCTDPTTDPLAVDENEVVVATLGLEEGKTEEEDVLFITSATVEKAEDNIVAFQDPDNANKTLVCHKAGPAKEFLISVGTPAALNGHMAHGDKLVTSADQCGTDDMNDTETLSTSDDDSRGGPPDHAGRPDHAGPPDGNSEDT